MHLLSSLLLFIEQAPHIEYFKKCAPYDPHNFTAHTEWRHFDKAARLVYPKKFLLYKYCHPKSNSQTTKDKLHLSLYYLVPYNIALKGFHLTRQRHHNQFLYFLHSLSWVNQNSLK